MNLAANMENLITITVSRKNIEGLLSQLDTKAKNESAQIMRKSGDTLLILVAEENDDHYASVKRDEEAQGRSGSSGPGQEYAEAH
jgi:hypothetical protein